MDSKKVQFIRVNGDTLKAETTDEEKKFRKTQYPDDKSILKIKEKVICTSCGKSLKEKISSKDIRVHPVLDVLWCKKCEEFYSDGEFSADEDGSDKYCRWCAQGGSLYCCSYCSVAFCAKCVRRNFDKKVMKDIEDDEWKCFICVTRPLWPLRAICDAAKRYVDSGSKSRKTTRVSTAPSEDSAAESEASSKRSKRKRKNDKDSTEEEKYNADSEDTTSLETTRSKRKHVSSSDDNSSEKRSSRRKKVDKEDVKPKPHADESKKEKFEAIITDTINESAVLRKLLSKKEVAWKKDYINIDVTVLRKTAQQAEEEFSKFFSDIVTSVKLIEKSFKDKWSVLQSELKTNEENKELKESEINEEITPLKEPESTPDETDVGNKEVDMVDVSVEPEIAVQEESSPVPPPRKSSNVSVNGTNDVSSIFDDDNTIDANDKPADLEKSMKSISDSLAVNVSSIIDSLDSDEENELRNQNTSLPETDPLLEVEPSKPSNGTEKDALVVISDKDDDDEVTVTEPVEKVDSTLDEDKAKMSLLLSSSDAATTDNEKPKPSATDSELSGVSVLHSDQDDLQKTKLKKKKTRKELNSLVTKEVKSPEGEMNNDATDDEKEIKKLGNLNALRKRKSRHSSESDNKDKETENVTEEKLVKSSSKKKKPERTSLVSYFGEASDNDSDASNISFSKFNSVLESKNKAFLNGEEDLSKKMLLFSSDDEKKDNKNCMEDVVSIDSDDASLKSTEKKKPKSDEKKSSKKSEAGGGSSKKEEVDADSSKNEFRTESIKKEKPKWRQDSLLKGKLSEIDTSDEERIIQREKERRKLEAEKETEKSDNSSDSEDIFRSNKQTKKSTKRRKVKVESSGSEFEIKDEDRSDSDDSVQIVSDRELTPPPKNKKKRRRIKNLDNSDNTDDEENEKTPGSASKGRKNIRKMLKEEDLAEITKRTAKEEEERKKRIAERQAMFNESFKIDEDINKAPDRLVLDFDPETKKELIVVHKDLVRKLKPHQAKGVKFMWDSCFESVKMAEKSPGGGCILAHCMGLGKTLQVITLVHTVMRYPQLKVNRVLVLCPLSTVLNWVAEFDMWLQDVDYGDDIDVFHLSKASTMVIRADLLNNWFRRGGVMVLGYEMFRNLVKPNSKVRKKLKDYFTESLLEPGPDLVVCDEGHMLKNEQTAISQATMKIQTKRRIVLTGTPLQNNLTEYHCMVQFVKQNLLGDRKEFLNRFANPITNGQYSDSTNHDVRVMKRRAHVLHKMLDGVIQRFDYNVLTPFLPSKHEFVILVSLSDLQAKLYEYYIDHFSKKFNPLSTLFKDYQIMRLIWTHPYAMKLSEERKRKVMEKKMENDEDSEGSLRDFVVHSDESEKTPDSDSENSVVSIRSDDSYKPKSKAKGGRLTRGRKKEMGINDEELVSLDNGGPAKEDFEDVWWKNMVTEEEMNDYRMGPKLVLLFAIIQQCENIGDKILVFSQSIPSLDMIEYFLEKWEEIQANDNSEKSSDHYGTWQKGIDYFRLDGQTSPELRTAYCNSFNKTTNSRARLFLISTRAGGLGINLTAANRVIIFDASWNPSYDVQSIFRIYRFGQSKPCYIYRFLSQGTMEEKIYERQVTKLSISCRVVDEQQIDRHFNNADIVALYEFNRKTPSQDEIHKLPKDRLMAEVLKEYKHVIVSYHEHDSLLENQKEEELTEEERKQAWEDYENEKKGILNQNMPAEIAFDRNAIMEALKKEHPNVNEGQLQIMHSMVVDKLKRHYVDQIRLWQMQQTLQMKAAQRQAPPAPGMFVVQNPQMRNLEQPANEKFEQPNMAGSSTQK